MAKISKNLNEAIAATTDPKKIAALLKEAQRSSTKPSIEEEAAALKKKPAATKKKRQTTVAREIQATKGTGKKPKGYVEVPDNSRPGRVRSAADALAPITAATAGKRVAGLEDIAGPTDADLRGKSNGTFSPDEIAASKAAEEKTNEELAAQRRAAEAADRADEAKVGTEEDLRVQSSRTPIVTKTITKKNGLKTVVQQRPKAGFLETADATPFEQDSLPQGARQVSLPGLDQLMATADHIGQELGTHADKADAEVPGYYTEDYDNLRRMHSEVYKHIGDALAYHNNPKDADALAPSKSRTGGSTTERSSTMEDAQWNAEQAAEKLKTVAQGLHAVGTDVHSLPVPISEFNRTPSGSRITSEDGELSATPNIPKPASWLAGGTLGNVIDSAVSAYKDHLKQSRNTIGNVDTDGISGFHKPDPTRLLGQLDENHPIAEALRRATELDSDPASVEAKTRNAGEKLAGIVEVRQAQENKKLTEARFGVNQKRDAEWAQQRIELAHQGIHVPETPMTVVEADGSHRTLSPREHADYLSTHDTNIRPLAGLRPNEQLSQIIRTRAAALPSTDLLDLQKNDREAGEARQAEISATPGRNDQLKADRKGSLNAFAKTMAKRPARPAIGAEVSDEEKASMAARFAAGSAAVAAKTNRAMISEGLDPSFKDRQSKARDARLAAGAQRAQTAPLVEEARAARDLAHAHWETYNPRPTLGDNTEKGSYEARMSEWESRKPTDIGGYLRQFPNAAKDIQENQKRESMGARYREPHTPEQGRNALDHWNITHPEMHTADPSTRSAALYSSDAWKNPAKYLEANGGSSTVSRVVSATLGPLAAGNRGKHPLDWNMNWAAPKQGATPTVTRRSRAGGAPKPAATPAPTEPAAPTLNIKPVAKGRESIFRQANGGI